MKKKFTQLMRTIWLALISIGVLVSQMAQAQSVPDIQWTKPGSSLAVTYDGNITTTEYISQGNIPGFPSVNGDGVVKYSLQGDRMWSTGLIKGGYYLGGKIQGYDYEAIGPVLLTAATADGGVAVMGKTSLRGIAVATKVNANGAPGRWEEGDIFWPGDGTIYEDLVWTGDGGFLLLMTVPQPNSTTNVMIRKYDVSGKFSWTKTIAYPTPNPSSPDRSLTKGESIITTPDGGYLITGYYNTTGVLISEANRSLIGNTGWVAKLDSDGNVLWQKLLTGLPISTNVNGPLPSSVLEMLPVTDAIALPEGTGYVLVGFGTPPHSGQMGPPPSTALLELNLDGSFKRARLIDPGQTEPFLTLYKGANNARYYAVGHSSIQNGVDPEILLVSAADLPANDPALFTVVARRTFDSPTNVDLRAIDKAGDGSLVFLGSNTQIVKLKAEPTTPGLTINAPAYNCATGAITFNVSGGDGSPITYSAPGISRASVTDNFGTVEQGLRNDPKVIPITATQSGVSVTYNFDLKAACSSTPGLQPLVLNRPIPDQSYTVGQSLPMTGLQVGAYFTDPNLGVIPNYVPNWSISITNLPDGLYVFSRPQDLLYQPAVIILGTPTTAGVYTVNVSARTNAGSVSTSFKITVSPTNQPPVNPLVLIAPDYNCATGAITFKTTGGDGTTIEYQALGITGWTTNPNQFVDKDSRTANDVQPFTLMARQNGNVVTYIWDLKAACSNNPMLKPPVVAPIPDLSYVVGESVYFVLGGYFSDPNMNIPNYIPHWSIGTSSLPPSLSLFIKSSELMYTPAAVIVGTATAPGVYTVSAGASTTGGSVSTTFKITITASPSGNPLALVAPDYDCATGAITFKTTGGDGTTIEYQAPGITGWTTNPNQFVDKDSRTANDVQPFTLMARQNGNVVTYVWDLKAACGRARVGIEELGTGLQVHVLGNPVEGKNAEVEISGAAGKAVHLNLIDSRGSLLHQVTIKQAETLERVSIPIENGRGILLLQVGTGTEQKKVKLLKP